MEEFIYSEDGKVLKKARKVEGHCVVPKGVTRIGNEAFEGCSSLKSIEILNSVTSIGDKAFWNCSSLESIEIPNSVTSIGDGAFFECSSLKSIEIPNSVTSIGGGAFVRCYRLESIEIPNSVTSIGNLAFLWCRSLKSIEIPNSVTSIGNLAFYECYSLESIEIPNSVTSIGNDAFNSCSSLESIEIPDSVTSIGDRAFQSCCGLESIEIPDSVTSIDNGAFAGCRSLKSIKIPNSVTSIGKEAFEGCYISAKNIKNSSRLNLSDYGLTICDVEQPDGLLIKGTEVVYCRKQSTAVTIPNSVTSIGDEAFYDCKSLESIEIPNSVTSIGNWAFLWCNSLESIEIPNSVTSIGDRAFYECSSLESIKIPNSVTSIGNEAFSRCRSLESIEIPNYVTSIGKEAFSYCSSLKSIKIPNSVTSIGKEAFEGCYISAENIKNSSRLNLSDYGLTICDVEQPDGLLIKGTEVVYCRRQSTAVAIPNSVTSIGKEAFSYCSNLESIEIPNYVTSIGDGAFEGCRSLKSIEIPNSVTSIGDRAFQSCCGLESIEIPNYVKSIGKEAFSYCSSLESIEIPNYVKSIGDGAFKGCSSLESIEIPNYVTNIGVWAFGGCRSLESIEIPNSVTSIGDWAFYCCESLESIEIPDSVTSIGNKAFDECSSLEEIKVDEDNSAYKDIDGTLFSKDGKQLIKYPEGKKSACYVVPGPVNWLDNCAIINNSISKILLPGIGVLHRKSIRIEGTVDVYIKEEHPENIELRDGSGVSRDEDYIFVEQGSTLYVPIGTGYAYRHHLAFSRFEKVVPINFDKLNMKELFGDCCTNDKETGVCEKDFNKKNRHVRDGRLNYDADAHQYAVDGKVLNNVTTVAASIFEPFNENIAYGMAKKLHMTKQEVLDMWEKKRNDSAEAGTLMHKKIEEFYDGKDFEDDDTMVLFRQFTTMHKLNPYRTEWAIYDEELNIAGTLDMLDYTNGKYTLYDWKRTDKMVENGNIVKCGYRNKCALPPFEHIKDCCYYKYALQTSIYRFVLERKYGINVEGSKLVVLHPTYNQPYVIDVPYMKEDVEKLLNMRK